MVINYRFDRVRFMHPVFTGSEIRVNMLLKSVNDKGKGRLLLSVEHTIQIQGVDKPACVAEMLYMCVPRPSYDIRTAG